MHQAFILLGESYTGKSTMLTVVAELLFVRDSLSHDLVRMNPSQFSSDIIYGHYDSKRLEWIPGIFTAKLTAPIGHQTERWIVLDGVLDSLWIESMNSLLDSNRKVRCAPEVRQQIPISAVPTQRTDDLSQPQYSHRIRERLAGQGRSKHS